MQEIGYIDELATLTNWLPCDSGGRALVTTRGPFGDQQTRRCTMRATLFMRDASKIPFKVTMKQPRREGSPLLSPLPLYRAILRAHRKLPHDQRSLGDMYVKAEFRAHRDVENPLQIIGFLSSWQKYLEMVLQNTKDDWKKYHLDDHILEKMSDDQIVQLHELMKSTQKVYKDGEEEAFTIDENGQVLPR